ncbi:Oidioi.mRNA.OKI2018_I69.chr1.g2428.t1.cds [Oikopleura dioica]|uniref:Oidioi.mRNA.OKI2018_I69.chr1.g2428.t1.cds n=1 Tax=Oikopleura dioica TaxID=34765 RepID=A0ABN7SY02_OIKDI|nr:Oidioi.mRNA.OKI2018_I69.chr1.g2428.t1.cds [Oikopleura dioica]
MRSGSAIQKYRNHLKEYQQATMSDDDESSDEEIEEVGKLTSARCLSMTCGCFTFVCGMIGYFYLLAAPQMATFPSLKWQSYIFLTIGIVLLSMTIYKGWISMKNR